MLDYSEPRAMVIISVLDQSWKLPFLPVVSMKAQVNTVKKI